MSYELWPFKSESLIFLWPRSGYNSSSYNDSETQISIDLINLVQLTKSSNKLSMQKESWSSSHQTFLARMVQAFVMCSQRSKYIIQEKGMNQRQLSRDSIQCAVELVELVQSVYVLLQKKIKYGEHWFNTLPQE